MFFKHTGYVMGEKMQICTWENVITVAPILIGQTLLMQAKITFLHINRAIKPIFKSMPGKFSLPKAYWSG